VDQVIINVLVEQGNLIKDVIIYHILFLTHNLLKILKWTCPAAIYETVYNQLWGYQDENL
jgi:hypothetical protein